MGNWSSKSKSASASHSAQESSSASRTSFSNQPYTSAIPLGFTASSVRRSQSSARGSYSVSGSSSSSNQPHTSPTSLGFTASKVGRSQSSTASSVQGLKTSNSFSRVSHVPANSSRVILNVVNPARPKVAKPAGQRVKYSVNNYAPPKVPENERQQPECINLPLNRLPDKFGLRICLQYSSKGGCSAVLCRRLHVCQYWVMNKCRFNNCSYDHSFTSSHNNNIINVFLERRDFNINTISETLQNNYRRKRKLLRKEKHICIHNMMDKCTRKTCSLVHSKKPYQWEIRLAEGRWIPFSHEQSNNLELLYSHPAQKIVELPQLSSRLSQHKELKELGSLLSQAQTWNVDLENMVLASGKLNYYVRRLSTPSDVTCDFNLATRWIWYWQDDLHSWKPYTDGVMKYFVVALSDQLEHHLHFEQNYILKVEIGNHLYDIDVREQIQRNLETGKIRKIRRRPVCRKVEREEHPFDKLFLTSKPSDKKYMLLPVLPKTSEFINIENMMTASLSNICISSVFQIRNHHLWKTYQNKKHQLLTLYCNDISKVNEQYLFHGTKHNVIEKICSDNLDWRLFGSNVGHVYGQGAYFSNRANLADRYSETNPLGQKAMFVLFVLVATMTVGNTRMEIPPENPETGRCFDTTCNDEFDSCIFVKYNRDEYYPAYLVRYSHN